VKIGAESKAVYVCRGDVANRAIQLAGLECGLFAESKEIAHCVGELDKMSDVQLVQLLAQEAQLLLEDHSRERGNGSGDPA
jgi:hypothetical protein